MTSIVPTVGRIVLYKVNSADVYQINARRKDGSDKRQWHAAIRSGAQVHVGNDVKVGDVFPMIVTRVWGDTPDAAINGSCFLDGNDILWVTSSHCGTEVGDYHWMEYQKGQAAKAEALETKLKETSNG